MTKMSTANYFYPNVKILKSSLLICLQVLQFMTTLIQGQNFLANQLLPENYDKNEVPIDPSIENGTLLLTINSTIQINSFSIEESKSNLTSDLTLCHKWIDYRLKPLENFQNETNGTNSMVRLSKFDQFWLPVIYFRNGRTASLISSVMKIEYLEIWPKQKLLNYCSRLSTSFFCRFNLANFPFEENFCSIELENLQNKDQHLIDLRLAGVKTPLGNSKLRIRNHYIRRCDPLSSDLFKSVQDVSNATSCSQVDLRLVRNVSYYVIRYYAPTFLMVAMSFIEFWLPTNAWPGRVILTCTVLVTLITTSKSAYDEVLIEYMSSLYWWLWGCQFLVFATIVEYAIALAWVQFINDKKSAHTTGQESPDGHYFGKDGWFKTCGNCIGACLGKVFGPLGHFDNPQERNKVDYVSRILFPILLLLFLIIYIVLTIPAWAQIYRFN